MYCSICGLSFELAETHNEVAHLGKKENRCLFCGQLFDTVHLMFDHITGHDGSVYCYMCKESFVTYELLLEHLDYHRTLHIYGCQICGWTSANKIYFLDHKCQSESATNDSGVESISIVNTKFKNTKNKLKVPKNKSPTVPVPATSACISNNFKDKLTIIFIRSRLKEDGFYYCPDCPKKLKTYKTFKYHLFAHNNCLKYECDLCKKRFPDQYKLKAHMKSHSTIKYYCWECPRTYKYKNNLKIHIEGKHLSKFKCASCNYEATSKHSLQIHLHIKKCCGKIFLCSTLYKHHIDTKKHIFRCKYCDKRFHSDTLLRSHESIDHRNIVCTFECPYCKSLYRSKHKLAKHKRIHHKSK